MSRSNCDPNGRQRRETPPAALSRSESPSTTNNIINIINNNSNNNSNNNNSKSRSELRTDRHLGLRLRSQRRSPSSRSRQSGQGHCEGSDLRSTTSVCSGFGPGSSSSTASGSSSNSRPRQQTTTHRSPTTNSSSSTRTSNSLHRSHKCNDSDDNRSTTSFASSPAGVGRSLDGCRRDGNRREERSCEDGSRGSCRRDHVSDSSSRRSKLAREVAQDVAQDRKRSRSQRGCSGRRSRQAADERAESAQRGRSQQPTALFLMGLPGAGKTTVKRKRQKKEYFVDVEPDQLKRYHPQFSSDMDEDTDIEVHRWSVRRAVDAFEDALMSLRCTVVALLEFPQIVAAAQGDAMWRSTLVAQIRMDNFVNWCQAHFDLHQSQRILIEQVNPKKVGTLAHARYEIYKKAETVGDFTRLNAGRNRKTDWSFDSAKGFIRLDDSPAVPSPRVVPCPVFSAGGKASSEEAAGTVPQGAGEADAAQTGPDTGPLCQAKNRPGEVHKRDKKDKEDKKVKKDKKDKKEKKEKSEKMDTGDKEEKKEKHKSRTGKEKRHKPGHRVVSQRNVQKAAPGQRLSGLCQGIAARLLPRQNRELVTIQAKKARTLAAAPQLLLAASALLPAGDESSFWSSLDTPSSSMGQKRSRSELLEEAATLASLVAPFDRALPPPSSSRQSQHSGARTLAVARPGPSGVSASAVRASATRAHRRLLAKRLRAAPAATPPRALLVRDLVYDYVEGQPDPVATDQSVKRTAAGFAEDAPIFADNRPNFAWVAKVSRGRYTHCAEAAQSDTRMPGEDPRCAICGQGCSKERLFKVRCYRRRSPSDPPETEVPRVLRPEVYNSGQRCMQGLLGVPPVPSKRVGELRDRLGEALRSRKFVLQNWVEPLRRLGPTESKSFATVLSGELSRVVRDCSGPKATWRRMAAEGFAKRVASRITSSLASDVPGSSPSDLVLESDEMCRELILRSRMRHCQTTELRCYDEEEAPSAAGGSGPPLSPHELYGKEMSRGKRPPYVIVIPSFGCPQRLKTNTLAFLRRQQVPQSRIEVWVAPGSAPGEEVSERERYRKALSKEWRKVQLRVGAQTITELRWAIAKQHPEGTHIVSLDDDVPDIFEKFREGPGHESLRPLPPGGLEALIHHAHDLMRQEQANVWGINPNSSPVNLAVSRISRRCGLLSSLVYGFLNRPDKSARSTCCPAADELERSCRAFTQDGVMLRYLMYSARTIFKAQVGAELEATARLSEEKALQDLCAEFPVLLALRQGTEKGIAASCCFRLRGPPPLSSDGKQQVAVSQPSSATGESQGGDVAQRRVELRQAQEEKVMLSRCIALQERLSRLAEEAEALEASAEGGEINTGPEVLDDIIRIATGGGGSLSGLGLTAVSSEPPPLEYRSIIPKVAPSPQALPSQPAQPSTSTSLEHTLHFTLKRKSAEPLASGGIPGAQPLPTETQLALLAAPGGEAPSRQPPPAPPPRLQPERQVVQSTLWDGSDNPLVESYEFTGFSRDVLNRCFVADRVTLIQGRRSFWDKSRTVFMYWQTTGKRWALVQRWDKDTDLLVKVRSGEERGWAFQIQKQGQGLWSEYGKGSWKDVRVSANLVFYPEGKASVGGTSRLAQESSFELGALSASWRLVPPRTPPLMPPPLVHSEASAQAPRDLSGGTRSLHPMSTFVRP
ncbi:unnamed protein product [Polarella glacialis]|uniref:Zeta toxin domain-containing protein n=1 Tax=Polarella glacialis TaxID=89957 RepID=A0A813F4W4_POLGL|nr:unnamed protein product [Polarella glacialis]